MTRRLLSLTIILISLTVISLLIILGSKDEPERDTGPTPAELRPSYQEIYLDLVARAYQADPSLDLDRVLGPGWADETLENSLQAILDKTPSADSEAIARLRNLATALDVRLTTREGRIIVESDDSSPKRIIVILSVGILGLILLGIVAVFAVKSLGRPYTLPAHFSRSPYRVEPTTWQGEAQMPLIQFASAYAFGDDYYDPAFSIDTPESGYLGECGIGILETVGQGKPKRVTAFEVWVFDINDAHTVSQILTSDYAYGNQALKTKLSRKGSIVLARPGQRLKLETGTLRVRARLAEIIYGQAPNLPEKSFFETLKVEVSVWSKRG